MASLLHPAQPHARSAHASHAQATQRAAMSSPQDIPISRASKKLDYRLPPTSPARVAAVVLDCPFILHKSTPKSTSYDISNLTCNKDVQSRYRSLLKSNIDALQYRDPNNPASKLRYLMNTVKSTATEAIGLRKPNQNRCTTNDSIVVDLANKRKQLRINLNNNNKAADRSKERSQINHLQKLIKNRLKQLKCEEADNLVRTISSTDESRRMFEAVRLLTGSKPNRPITVHNDEGHCIATDSEKAEKIKSWFQNHFTGNEDPLKPFEGEPRALDTIISPQEVHTAIRKLKNNRASGPDNIPNEILRYADMPFCHEFANIINQCFETHTYIKDIGESILTPLQKPHKPLGPVKSLRPLNLLNGVRKILSVIALNRTQNQINMYTGPYQCAYKSGHSCADIVWSQRMLISVVLRKHCEVYKMGIDMTSAFDTIKRSTILRLLVDAGCSADDVRLIRMLLANTTVRVRVNNETSAEFTSTNGAFQGDSLSGALFTLSLAGGLHHLRAVVVYRPNPPITDSGMPAEWEYADDVDFVDDDLENLEQLLPKCTEILSEWDLHVNESKTEFVKLYVANKGDLDNDGKLLTGNEAWRVSKSLGSLLCSTRDIQHRINLAHGAFQTYSKIWLKGTKIPLSKKLHVYEAQVVSVLMYNCGSWSAPKHVLSKLDTCQRKHLRKILNICWPTGVISNRELYRRCRVLPITERVRKARWTLLGHILRMDDNSPAALSLRYAMTSSDMFTGRRGRPRTNLFSIIQSDLKTLDLSFKNCDDLDFVKVLASNRSAWRNMFMEDESLDYIFE